MKMEITEKKENVVLKRTEVRFVIDHAGEATPSKGAVVDEIAKLTKAKRDTIVLNSIESVYGSGKSKGYAKIYATKEDAQAIEPEYILKRNGMQKPEYVAPEAAPSEGFEWQQKQQRRKRQSRRVTQSARSLSAPSADPASTWRHTRTGYPAANADTPSSRKSKEGTYLHSVPTLSNGDSRIARFIDGPNLFPSKNFTSIVLWTRIIAWIVSGPPEP